MPTSYNVAVGTASSATLPSGVRLSQIRARQRTDAIVMLPGPTDSWRSYAPTFDQLPDTLHVIAVSQRGHGDSDKPMAGYQVEDFAADEVAFLDAAGASGPCSPVTPALLRGATRCPGRARTSGRSDPRGVTHDLGVTRACGNSSSRSCQH